MKISYKASILTVLAILVILGIVACSSIGWGRSNASPHTSMQSPAPPPMPPYGETHVPFFLSVINPSFALMVGVEFIVEQMNESYDWVYVQTIRSDENGWVAFPQMLPLGTYRFTNSYAPYPYRVASGYYDITIDYTGILIWQDEPLPIQEGGFTYLTFVLIRDFILGLPICFHV